MFLIKLLLISTTAYSTQVMRLDNNKIEEFTPLKQKYELIIEENCAYCMQQISILKECVDEKDVVVVFDNRSSKSPEELKKILRKKKITFKTILLNKEITETYAYKGVTPTLWINSSKSQSFTGVASCDFLKSKM